MNPDWSKFLFANETQQKKRGTTMHKPTMHQVKTHQDTSTTARRNARSNAIRRRRFLCSKNPTTQRIPLGTESFIDRLIPSKSMQIL